MTTTSANNNNNEGIRDFNTVVMEGRGEEEGYESQSQALRHGLKKESV